MLHLEKLFYSVPQRMSVCGFCLSYTLPWDLGLFCCIPTFVFLNIVCGGNFHLSRQQMWMRTKFSNRCRIRRWPNRLPFYSSNNSGHWASVGYTWYGFTNIIRHQLFVRQYCRSWVGVPGSSMVPRCDHSDVRGPLISPSFLLFWWMRSDSTNILFSWMHGFVVNFLFSRSQLSFFCR